MECEEEAKQPRVGDLSLSTAQGPLFRVVLANLLVCHQTEGLSLYVHSVLGNVLEGVKEVLELSHHVHTSNIF